MTATAGAAAGVPWTALVRSAIVGTQREAPAIPRAGDDALDALLFAPEDAVPEARLLRAAAVIGVARRAGAKPVDLARVEVEFAPPETLARCSSEAALDLIRLIAEGNVSMLAAEWLPLADEAQVRVPEELLPELLALGHLHRELQAKISRVIGARGAWLAAQQPAWSYATGGDDLERAWHEGDVAARLRALGALRASDPARARELLQAAWDREPPSERASFVGALQSGLSAADEPFLEAALDDRRKEVRSAAAALLARLPQSRLAQRATARADVLVTVKRGLLGGPALGVELPASCDAAMQRDGIVARPPAGTGERAWWLQQIVARVPPSHWTSAYDVDPSTMLKLALRSDAAEALRRGFAEAAANYADDDWRCAIVELRELDPALALHTYNANPDWPATPRFRAAVLRALDADDRYGNLAYVVPGPWDAELSRAVVRFMAREIAERRRAPHLPSVLLAVAAKRVAPDAPGLLEGWPETASDERMRAAIDTFRETVRFRAAMRAHLKAGR